jgi:hypothetical protein
VERIVAVLGVKADFDVVVAAAMAVQDQFYLAAEIPFDLQNDSTNASFRVMRFIGEDLLGIGYMQLEDLPLPTAPRIAIPVNRPRSGISSQCGVSDGPRRRGLCTSPTTTKRSSRLLGSGYRGRISPANPFRARVKLHL